MDSKGLKVGVDIGGTNLRVGFVRVDSGRVISFRSSSLPRRRGTPDIRAAVARASAFIVENAARLEKNGWRVVRQVGVGAPGAYLENGRAYPGTAPNIPELEKIELYRLFARRLGSAWTVTPSHVQNDGVAQGRLMAAAYARVAGMRRGKIIALIPGTGFGAGVFEASGGNVRPVPGPQQLFDVVVRRAERGEPIIVAVEGSLIVHPARGGEPLMAEHLMTGRALECLGSQEFGRDMNGKALSRAALRGTGEQKKRARRLFVQVGRDFARFVHLTRSGNFKKCRVPFKPPTRGTRVYLLGGRWLLEGAGRALSLPEARRVLAKTGPGVRMLTADRIKNFAASGTHAGVLGAALSVRGS